MSFKPLFIFALLSISTLALFAPVETFCAAERPEACPEIYAPVVSLGGPSKGKMYSNACEACSDPAVTSVAQLIFCEKIVIQPVPTDNQEEPGKPLVDPVPIDLQNKDNNDNQATTEPAPEPRPIRVCNKPRQPPQDENADQGNQVDATNPQPADSVAQEKDKATTNVQSTAQPVPPPQEREVATKEFLGKKIETPAPTEQSQEKPVINICPPKPDNAPESQGGNDPDTPTTSIPNQESPDQRNDIIREQAYFGFCGRTDNGEFVRAFNMEDACARIDVNYFFQMECPQ